MNTRNLAETITITLLALVALASLSSLWSDHPLRTLGHALHLGLATVFCAYVAARLPPRPQLSMLAGLFLALMAASLLVVYATPYGVMSDGIHATWRGAFRHKNQLGCMAALAVPIPSRNTSPRARLDQPM